MKPVCFLHPPLAGPPSGGHRYNQRLIACAEQEQFPLLSNAVGPPAPSAENSSDGVPVPFSERYLWDSLLMPVYPLMRPPPASVDVWLMHFLPSLDPSLSLAEAAVARRREDHIAASCRLFLATGRRMADELRRRYPAVNVSVCEPGVDDVYAAVGVGRQARCSVGQDVGLLTVANLLPAKGYSELLAILLGQLDLRWCWHIVGSGGPDPGFTRRFASQARDLIEARRIVLHGVLAPKPLAALMQRMDVYIAASHFESYGMALAEALAAGLPVVTTDVGDAGRMVGSARAGYCVPVGHWNDFAQALAVLIMDDRQRSAFCMAAERRARTWRQAFGDVSAALRSIE